MSTSDRSTSFPRMGQKHALLLNGRHTLPQRAGGLPLIRVLYTRQAGRIASLFPWSVTQPSIHLYLAAVDQSARSWARLSRR